MKYYFIESVNTLSTTGKSRKGALLQAAVSFFAEKFAHVKISPYLCSAFHIEQGGQSADILLRAFFMPCGIHIEFRPVWSVNAPTALFKVECNGERNSFCVRSGEKTNTLSNYIFKAFQK